VSLPGGHEILKVEEVRHTSASGGQKGRKPELYRLIPREFEAALADSVFDPFRDQDYRGVKLNVERFWLGAGTDTRALISAAAWAESAMGGPLAARYHVARVYGTGAMKYDDDNWKKGYPWSWSYDALHRHLEAIRRGELIDPEMGVPHWANIWWHCATLWWYATYNVGVDDRPKKEVS
jgi:hypothetical protein